MMSEKQNESFEGLKEWITSEDVLDDPFVRKLSRNYVAIILKTNDYNQIDDTIQDAIICVLERGNLVSKTELFDILRSCARSNRYRSVKEMQRLKEIVEEALDEHTTVKYYSSSQDEWSNDVQDEVFDKETMAELLLVLPPMQKMVVLLKARGFTNGEIAKRLNLRKPTINNYLASAKNHFHKIR